MIRIFGIMSSKIWRWKSSMSKGLLDDLFTSYQPKPQTVKPLFSDYFFQNKPNSQTQPLLSALFPPIQPKRDIEEKSIDPGAIINESHQRITQLMRASYQPSVARTLPVLNVLPYDKPRYVKDSWVINIDLRGSTKLAEKFPQSYPKIIQCFVNETSEIAKAYGAEIGNFLGDGLTAILQGSETRKNSNRAVETAIAMNTVTAKISKLFAPHTGQKIECGIGVAYGNFWVMKAGAKFTSDSTRIWTGAPVNRASKYAEKAKGEIILCQETYSKLRPSASVNKEAWESRLPDNIENLPSMEYAADLVYTNLV